MHFQIVLDCFATQIETDFDPKIIEKQQEEQLDLTSSKIQKVKTQLAEDLAQLEINLNSESSSENYAALFVVLVGISCLLANQLAVYGSFGKLTTNSSTLLEFSNHAI